METPHKARAPYYRIAAVLAVLLALAGAYVFNQSLAQNAAEFSGNPEASDVHAVSNTQNILRLHVIANSNSAQDQAVKLAVRDSILSIMPQTASKPDAAGVIKANGNTLYQAARTALEAQGLDYGVQLKLGSAAFPDKTYGDVLYPAGEYDALQVILGDGAGRNWWCVLFPPLCIVDAAVLEDMGSDEIVFESSIAKWWEENMPPAA